MIRQILEPQIQVKVVLTEAEVSPVEQAKEGDRGRRRFNYCFGRGWNRFGSGRSRD